MCGSTASQDELQQEQIEAYQQASQLTQQQYANQQAIYGPMVQQFQSILQKGPGQQGYSPEELQNLNSQAVEGTAENYSAAAKATNEGIAAQGGGTSPLPTGAAESLKSSVGSSAAQEESREESQVETGNYQQGLNDYMNAAEGLESIASGENPLGYESNETSSGTAAATTANQIASQQNSWINAAVGAAGTVAGGWAQGGFKK